MTGPWMRTLLTAGCLLTSPVLAADAGFVRLESQLQAGAVRVLFTGAQIRPGLILTCAHCCRAAGGLGGRVVVHVLGDTVWRPYRSVSGTVACFDLALDVGLVVLDDPAAIPVVYVLAPRGTTIQEGDGVFAYRWRKEPEQLIPVAGQITRVNPYLGAPTLETNTPPESGESGGPLVRIDTREIIGVTSAVDVTRQRGLYSGLEAIYQLLDQCQPALERASRRGH